MTLLIKTTLISHVLFGVLGTILVYALWLSLLKKTPSVKFLKYTSLGAFFSFIFSWLTGGYYYVVYYGGVVKPKIVSGAYPWAHKIITEAKEHAFLFLPFVVLALVLVIYRMGDQFAINEKLRKQTALFVGVITTLAVLITLAGIVISGSVR